MDIQYDVNMDKTGSKLSRVLDGARAELEAGLREAEAELAELDARRSALMALIARARAALGLADERPSEPPPRPLTLHEAMALVLREHGNGPLSAREIADEINQRRLYAKRDGSDVEVSQIHARAKNYANQFAKVGSKLRLDE